MHLIFKCEKYFAEVIQRIEYQKPKAIIKLNPKVLDIIVNEDTIVVPVIFKFLLLNL